ncbi:MAG: ABC transporter permease [Conexivisphaerales archaeon]
MLSKRSSDIILPVASVALLIVVWQLIVSLKIVDPFFLPPPSGVISAAVQLSARGELETDILISTERALEGYALGSAIGIVAGLAMGTFRTLAELAEPAVEFFRQIPEVAWIPLAILIFGLGGKAVLFIITYGSVWPVLINTYDGVKLVDTSYKRAALSLGATPFKMFYKVNLRAALPRIYSGLWTSIGIAFRSLVVAELAVATTGVGSGIGYMMNFYYNQYVRTDVLVLGMVVLAVLGFVAQKGLSAAMKRLLRWLPQFTG